MSVICQVQIPVISDVSFQLLCFPQPAKSAETHCPSHIGCLAATVVFPLENSSQLCSSCPLHMLVKIDSVRQDFHSRKIWNKKHKRKWRWRVVFSRQVGNVAFMSRCFSWWNNYNTFVVSTYRARSFKQTFIWFGSDPVWVHLWCELRA